MRKAGEVGMTNQEYLATLKPDQCYAVIDWLLHRWGRKWANTRDAVILWLADEYKPDNFERVKKLWNLEI
jgi:hypothetical protein